MEQTLENQIKKTFKYGVIALGLTATLMSIPHKHQYTILKKEFTLGGDVSYVLKDDNIIKYTVPLVRVGMGGISKEYIPKNSTKYNELMSSKENTNKLRLN